MDVALTTNHKFQNLIESQNKQVQSTQANELIKVNKDDAAHLKGNVVPAGPFTISKKVTSLQQPGDYRMEESSDSDIENNSNGD